MNSDSASKPFSHNSSAITSMIALRSSEVTWLPDNRSARRIAAWQACENILGQGQHLLFACRRPHSHSPSGVCCPSGDHLPLVVDDHNGIFHRHHEAPDATHPRHRDRSPDSGHAKSSRRSQRAVVSYFLGLQLHPCIRKTACLTAPLCRIKFRYLLRDKFDQPFLRD